MTTYTTNVPFPTFGTTGFVIPLESAILAGVQADINTAFGGNLSFSSGSPELQLATSLAAIIGDMNVQFLQYVNQVDPAYSQGRMQDAIGRIYFLTRNPATSTVVQCTCIGAAGTTIPVNALASDSSGNIYVCTQAGTFTSSGTLTLPFANVATGAIPCAANTLTTIYQAIAGWDSINNPAAGILGSPVESASAFELRRGQSVAQNAAGTLPAILGAVLSVAGVTDAYVVDNSQNTAQTIGGVTIAANSVYVCVNGGLASAIAFAIWTRKAPGCSYTGNTSYTVTDPTATYTTPPSYTVSYETPTSTAIYLNVTLKNSALVPATAAASIASAIITAFAGTASTPKARIGSLLLASQYYSAVIGVGSWVNIISVQMGVANVSFTGTIAGSVLTASSVTGTFVVGQFIYAAGITTGTYISSFGTGTGGAGTYNISQSWTIGTAESMVASTMANSLQMNINQAPVTAANQISLTLQ